MTKSVAEALRESAEVLTRAGIATPNRDVRRLLAHVLHTDTAHLTAIGSDSLDEPALKEFRGLVEQRALRRPVSHLTGTRSFWKSNFRITPDVLDPRPETEVLVQLALDERFQRVLDLGVGSGAILISLLLERPEACGVGTDVSPEAVLIAGQNAELLGVADRITLPLSDWFDDIGGTFDLIISNPPYIAATEMENLEPEVGRYEPRLALTDEKDGLTAYRRISSHAASFLAPGGRVLVEIGPTQGEVVASLFESVGFSSVSVHADLDGRDRVIEARNRTEP